MENDYRVNIVSLEMDRDAEASVESQSESTLSNSLESGLTVESLRGDADSKLYDSISAFSSRRNNQEAVFGAEESIKESSDRRTRLGTTVLNMQDVFDDKNWYWIGIGGLLGFTVFFNCLFTLALTYLDPLGKPQAMSFDDDGDYEHQERNGSSFHSSSYVL